MAIEKEFTVKISMLEYKWKNLEKAAQKEGKTLDEFMQEYIQDFTDSDQTDVIRLAEKTLSENKYHEISLDNLFSTDYEPSEEELDAVMEAAAKVATRRNREAERKLFKEIEEEINKNRLDL